MLQVAGHGLSEDWNSSVLVTPTFKSSSYSWAAQNSSKHSVNNSSHCELHAYIPSLCRVLWVRKIKALLLTLANLYYTCCLSCLSSPGAADYLATYARPSSTSPSHSKFKLMPVFRGFRRSSKPGGKSADPYANHRLCSKTTTENKSVMFTAAATLCFTNHKPLS